jgi:hypothetical protein
VLNGHDLVRSSTCATAAETVSDQDHCPRLPARQIQTPSQPLSARAIEQQRPVLCHRDTFLCQASSALIGRQEADRP